MQDILIIFFLFLHENICCGYSLEVPHRGTSNENHNITLHGEIRKNIIAPLLTLLLLNMACPVLANSVDPDLLASEEANWSGSALFVVKYVNNQKPGSSNLIGWKLEVGMAS